MELYCIVVLLTILYKLLFFQSVVTCMDILAKSSTDEGSISCIVVGAESKDVYILDPEAFTILGKVNNVFYA